VGGGGLGFEQRAKVCIWAQERSNLLYV